MYPRVRRHPLWSPGQSQDRAILVIFGALIFRMAGVLVCLLKTKLTSKERLFCMIAYTPKATVQAAIGSIPLTMGLSCGHVVLTVAVLAILITAPLGAFSIDLTYRKLRSLQQRNRTEINCKELRKQPSIKIQVIFDVLG